MNYLDLNKLVKKTIKHKKILTRMKNKQIRKEQPKEPKNAIRPKSREI